MNMLYNKLPESVLINGISYPIHTDFRVWIRASLLLENNAKNELDRLAEIARICLKPCGGKPMPELGELVSALIDFLLLGEQPRKPRQLTKKAAKKNNDIYSFEYDDKYIYAAFYGQYGIDLTSAHLHWWVFKALFDGLCGEHKFCRITEYRATDVSKIKDSKQRAYIRKMQNMYRLPDNRTQAEKDADIADALS